MKAEAVRSGRPSAAFDALFEAHWPRVYGVLLRLVGDPAEAEDLAIEVFWQLYRQPRPIGEERRLAGWLVRVATNLGLNELRGRRRRAHYEREAAVRSPEVLPGVAPNPAVEAERQLEQAAVRRVLARMKPRSAQLLVLRHSGLSYAEVAGALQLAPSSIGTLLARAEQEFESLYRAQEGVG
jgi:RNA polymerase sigma-70 factor (ECF subfamily)